MSDTLVSFVIVNYRVAEKVQAAVDSVFRYCSVRFEVIVVDNSTSADEFARLGELLGSRVQLLDARRNAGFGAGCNLGAAHATGEYVLFLNPDARLIHDCIGLMIADLKADPNLGALGGQLVDEQGVENHAAGRFVGLRTTLGDGKQMLVEAYRGLRGRKTVNGAHRKAQGVVRVDYVAGADLMMRLADFRRLGGFDETFFLYVEDTELQYRLRKQLGLHAAIDTRVQFFHEIGGTSNPGRNWRRCLAYVGCLHFVRKHHRLPYQAAYKSATLLLSAAQLGFGRMAGTFTLSEDFELLKTITRGSLPLKRPPASRVGVNHASASTDPRN